MKSGTRPRSGIITPAAGESPPGLYIHIPFCVSKCAYCSFTSYPCRREPPAAYLRALRQEAEDMAAHPWARERVFQSLFVGGGTPTVYSGEALAECISQVLRLFRFVAEPEVTLEANPDTVSREKLAQLRAAGVNRLSVGVQSFSDPVLRAAGRPHTGKEALQALVAARESGFDNLNLDLIYGLPGQTPAMWRRSLETALAFGPEHVALYELTVEEGTPFAGQAREGTLSLPVEEEVAEMEEDARQALAGAGIKRYEISNYCAPGRECRHNINYWRNGSYLGLGAAAVSCFSGLRTRSIADPDLYSRLVRAGRPPCAEAECLPLEARFRESVIMGMRMLEGVSNAMLTERFGLRPAVYYGATATRLKDQGLIDMTPNHVRLTPKGLPLANLVLSQLV